MFSKKKCERCGKEYRLSTGSENRGKLLCFDCIQLCSICEKKISPRNQLGIGIFRNDAERIQQPWISSGMCNECFMKEEEKLKQEQEKRRQEDELLRQAQLRQAQEILETPAVWTCEYCQTVNRGNFCSNCGTPRKRTY